MQATTPAELSKEQDRRIVELKSLFEFGTTLNTSQNLKTVLDTLLLAPMGRLLITQGAILLKKQSSEYEYTAVKGLPRKLIGEKVYVQADCKKPALIDEIKDAEAQEAFKCNALSLICPILSHDNCIGLFLLGAKLGNIPFTKKDIEYISSLANLAAPAIQNSKYIAELDEKNRQLEKSNQELNTVNEILKELNTADDADSVANINRIATTLAYAVMGEMMVQRCIILLEDPDDDLFKPTIVKGLRKTPELGETFDKLTAKLRATLKGVLTESLEDAEVRDVLDNLGVGMLTPLMHKSEMRGMILVGGRFGPEPFRENDLKFLDAIGNTAMSPLENARLVGEKIARERLEEELAIAKNIQIGLLPKTEPSCSGFDFHGMNVSSLQVGGDYYDFITIDEDRIAFAIGDVSGKGVGASLLMANLQASLHAMIDADKPLSAIVAKINNIIYQNTPLDKFITFFVGIIDTSKHEMTYVNAGHNPPYIFTDGGELKTLEVGGLILGMMPDVPFEQETVKLASGDWLLLFTDGVNEAMNEEGEEFEEYRIEDFIRENPKSTAKSFVLDLHDAVTKFCGGAQQSDDITILAVGVNNHN